jgi:hypothetical protein
MLKRVSVFTKMGTLLPFIWADDDEEEDERRKTDGVGVSAKGGGGGGNETQLVEDI